MNQSPLPQELLDLLQAGETVLFLGAGATRDAGGPTGGALAQLLAGRFSKPDISTADLRRFADVLTFLDEIQRDEIDKTIVGALKDVQPTAAHKLIPTFAWRAIFTTNYDRIVEVAYDTASDGSGRRAQDLRTTQLGGEVPSILDSRVVLLKLHGCISTITKKAPLVLTTDD